MNGFMKRTVTVDIGTTRTKLGYFDENGNQLISEVQATPTRADAWGTIYDSDALWSLIVRYLRRLDDHNRQTLEKIAIAGVGESGGLVGEDLRLNSPMILWHDQRGEAAINRLSAGERLRIYAITGLPANANYSISKIRWAVAAAPNPVGDNKWLNVSEYVAALMTGQRWAEYSLASRTMALDLRSATWSPEVCGLFQVDPSLLPRLEPASFGYPLTKNFAALCKLPPDVQVHVVGHDHMVGGVGAALSQGELLNSTGTTEGILFLRKEPSLDSTSATAMLANGIDCESGAYTLFASIPTGGSAFETLQHLLAMSESMLLTCIAALNDRYLAGQIDLARIPVVIPHFRGSPPPEKRASARGVIANLSSDVQAEDIVLGCFLGLAMQFKMVADLFPDPPASVKVIGPASENYLWLHLKADVLGTDLSVSKFPEVVSRGAQALASADRCDWSGCHPIEIATDQRRHEQIQEWFSLAKPIFERLEGV